MRRGGCGFAVVSAFAFLVGAQPLSAASIVVNVANPGFETPVTFTNTCCAPEVQNWLPGSIPGWSVTDPNSMADPGGVWAPVAVDNAQGAPQVFINPMSGTQVAYSNGAVISQTLSQNVTPNTRYSLSIGVGWRAELLPPFNASYAITLLAGTPTPTVLGKWTGNVAGNVQLTLLNGPTTTELLPLTRGGWQTIQFASQNISLAGVPLIIQLTSTSQLDFDNISLTAVTMTPEPGTYALMGSALLAVGVMLRRRRKSS